MFHIISNPVSGKKGNLRNPELVSRVFERHGLEYTLYQTAYKGEGKEIAERITREGGRDIVVVGGDGTLHEVLNGLSDPSVCRLGLIPSGTGNDFAYAAGLPTNAEQAAELIATGEAKDTDYIEVDGKRCMNVCGLGMDVDVLERCSRGKTRGKIKYLKSLLSSLFAFKGYKVTVEADGETLEKDALIAAVCNGKAFGGGIRICPVAEIDDHKFDVTVIDCPNSKFKIVKAFLKLMKGKIMEVPYLTHYRAERVRFSTADTDTVQLDGELYKGLDFAPILKTGLKFFR